ncbi:MAG: sugar phosphate nucleotidyltransferase [Oscillospiraceae bacterium]|nr:sugar phosphate nucleotidyltransferase [Oscillospiraceae bacterium]
MNSPTLIVMAAGMGSRYGGLKQIDPVGPSQEILLDYSVYDAIRAGFGKVVFVIKAEMEASFKENIGKRIAAEIPVEYVCQRLEELPEGFAPPLGRVKPWGTSHALYCCREAVGGPFAAINADDFYGADAFRQVAAFLREVEEGAKYHACMVAYRIENTLTENGAVTRGVCSVSSDGYLDGIAERQRIGWKNGEILDFEGDKATVIAPGTVVSMNIWGFPGNVMSEFEYYMSRFLRDKADNLESAEFYLPVFVDNLVKDSKADVKVLKTDAKWFGVTYREDKPALQAALRDMVKAGQYPEKLWG